MGPKGNTPGPVFEAVPVNNTLKTKGILDHAWTYMYYFFFFFKTCYAFSNIVFFSPEQTNSTRSLVFKDHAWHGFDREEDRWAVMGSDGPPPTHRMF